jgi:enoyl-[acyl-carrier-protein] reductase (NADH)
MLSPLSRAITGTTLYVDNGLNVMGMALDSVAMIQPEVPVEGA